MNKNLLLSSLFLFQICAANDISVESQTEETTLQCYEVTPEANIVVTECATAQATTEVTTEDVTVAEEEAVTTESEESAISEFLPMSLVFDFIMELDSLNDFWLNLMNSTKELNSRCANHEVDSSAEALKLVQTIHNYATSSENNIHGSLCSSLSEIASSDRNPSPESQAPHYIAIRLTFTQDNNNNPELWTAMQATIPALQETLEALEAVTESEETEAAEQPAQQENFITIITNAVNQLIAFADADNNDSVSKNVMIIANTNNTVE